MVDHVLTVGWSATSLRSAAEAIGLSHRALLYHFGSRDQLVQAVAAEVRRREQERLVADAAADASPEAVLRQAWARVSDATHLPYVRLHLELQVLAMSQPERFGSLIDLVSSWTAVIERLLQAAGLAPGAARSTATSLYALVRGLQLDLLESGDRQRVDAAFDSAAGVLLSQVPVGTVSPDDPGPRPPALTGPTLPERS